MIAVVRHLSRGIVLLLLDCGCWVECTELALEAFQDCYNPCLSGSFPTHNL